MTEERAGRGDGGAPPRAVFSDQESEERTEEVPESARREPFCATKVIADLRVHRRRLSHNRLEGSAQTPPCGLIVEEKRGRFASHKWKLPLFRASTIESETIAKRKVHAMKIPARIIGRGWVLAALFAAALCSAHVVCLWAGNTPHRPMPRGLPRFPVSTAPAIRTPLEVKYKAA